MDPTETTRRKMVEDINTAPSAREALEEAHGKVWDTRQLQEEFDVQSFSAPFVVVRRKEDGARGSLMFQHKPRLYFRWHPA